MTDTIERSYCDIATIDCRNPAGLRAGGGYAANADPPRTWALCIVCGGVCCASCGKRRRVQGWDGQRQLGRVCQPCWEEERRAELEARRRA